jgi:hypothetical protein
LWVLFPLIVGSVALVVGGFAWVARRDAAARAMRIGRLEVTEVLTEGALVAVRGDLHVVDPIEDPLAPDEDEDGVADLETAHYELRLVGGDRTDDLVRVRKGGRVWLSLPGGRRVEMDLNGAELQVPFVEVDRADEELSETMRRLVKLEGKELPERIKGPFVLTHRALRAGTTLTAIGTVEGQLRSRDSLAPSTADARLTDRDGLLLLTEDPLDVLKVREAEDVRALGRMIQAAIVIGIVIVAFGVIALFALGG